MYCGCQSDEGDKVDLCCRHDHWRQRLYFPAQPPISSLPMPTIPPLQNGVVKKVAKKVAKKKPGGVAKTPMKRKAAELDA